MQRLASHQLQFDSYFVSVPEDCLVSCCSPRKKKLPHTRYQEKIELKKIRYYLPYEKKLDNNPPALFFYFFSLPLDELLLLLCLCCRSLSPLSPHSPSVILRDITGGTGGPAAAVVDRPHQEGEAEKEEARQRKKKKGGLALFFSILYQKVVDVYNNIKKRVEIIYSVTQEQPVKYKKRRGFLTNSPCVIFSFFSLTVF